MFSGRGEFFNLEKAVEAVASKSRALKMLDFTEFFCATVSEKFRKVQQIQFNWASLASRL